MAIGKMNLILRKSIRFIFVLNVIEISSVNSEFAQKFITLETIDQYCFIKAVNINTVKAIKIN